MTFLMIFCATGTHSRIRNGIKAGADKRRLGVRVAPGGFTPPGGRGESLSRFQWAAGGEGK